MMIKKLTGSFIITVLSVLALCGCTGSAYNSSDKQKIEAVGRKCIEEYFTENLPDAQLISVHAVSANREMTLMALTNYVSGEYRENGLTYDYYFDVENRRLFTSKNYYIFSSRVKDKILNDLDLKDRADIISSDINIYLPDVIELDIANSGVGNEEGKLPPANEVMPFYAPVIPIEAVDDPEAYIYNKDRKEIIDVSLRVTIDASDSADFSKYSFDELFYAPKEDHIFLSYLCVHNALSVTYDRIGHGAEPTIVSKETLKAVGSYTGQPREYSISYEIWDEVKSGDSEKYDIIYKKTDYLNTETGEISTREQDFALTEASE